MSARNQLASHVSRQLRAAGLTPLRGAPRGQEGLVVRQSNPTGGQPSVTVSGWFPTEGVETVRDIYKQCIELLTDRGWSWYGQVSESDRSFRAHATPKESP